MNTGGGCHALLQGIFLAQVSNPCLLLLSSVSLLFCLLLLSLSDYKKNTVYIRVNGIPWEHLSLLYTVQSAAKLECMCLCRGLASYLPFVCSSSGRPLGCISQAPCSWVSHDTEFQIMECEQKRHPHFQAWPLNPPLCGSPCSSPFCLLVTDQHRSFGSHMFKMVEPPRWINIEINVGIYFSIK